MALEPKLCIWLSLLVAIAAADYAIELKDDGTLANSTLNVWLRCDNANLTAAIEKIRMKMDVLQLEFRTDAMLQDIRNYLKASPQNNETSSKSLASTEGTTVTTFDSSRSASCAEALSTGRPSGIYRLYLPAKFGLKPFYVYCLQDVQNGSAWTIVQRRENNLIDFYLDWAEYKRGFGHLNGNFFIGLDHLHAMTHAQMHELRIEMEDFEGEKRFAAYDRFAIADEGSKYALNMLGAFSGDAGDSLRYHAGRKFSTKDADHDEGDGNCAVINTGAWWYGNCQYSHLNGQYLRGEGGSDTESKGINWQHWHSNRYSLKYVHMAIRPVKFY